MSTTWLDLCNDALILCGADLANDLEDDDDENGRIANQLRGRCADAIVRIHPWNFSTEYFDLPAGGAPTRRFARRYPWLAKPYLLRIFAVQVGDRWVNAASGEHHGIWKVAGRSVITNLNGPITVEAGFRVEDAAQWDALAVQLFSVRLAAMMAPKLRRKEARQTNLWDQYRDMLPEARSVDGQEGTYEEGEDSSFLASVNQ